MAKEIRTLKFPGDLEPREIVDAKAREQLSQLSEDMANGLTDTEKALMLSLFKAAAYTENVSAKVTQLESLWRGSGDDNGGSEGGDDTEPVIYTITNNLTNVTTDNDAASIESGKLYTANLTAEDGYSIGSVVITMGGMEISAYSDGVVSIDSVTGDIVITAVAVQMDTSIPVYQLPEAVTLNADNAEYDTGYALFAGEDNDFSIVIDFDCLSSTSGNKLMYVGDSGSYFLQIANSSNWQWDVKYSAGGTKSVGYSIVGTGHRIVITHTKNASFATAYTNPSGSLVTTEAPKGTNTIPENLVNTILLQNAGGEVTVNDFKVYERVLVEAEINEYLGVA